MENDLRPSALIVIGHVSDIAHTFEVLTIL